MAINICHPKSIVMTKEKRRMKHRGRQIETSATGTAVWGEHVPKTDTRPCLRLDVIRLRT